MASSLSPQPSPLGQFLSQTILFQDLSLEQLNTLEPVAIAQYYDKGEILFHQGDEGTGFFIIKSGRIKVFKLSPEGKEQILHVFRAGDHFAEVPTLDGQCFPASAAALETAEVLFFPRQPFLTLLEQHPTLTINLLKSLARHLRRFSQLVDNLALREIPARLATYLLNLKQEQGELDNPHVAMDIVTLDLPKGQLAAQLGTIPETLSRTLAKLSRDGLIAIEGKQIHLLDGQRLQQLASGRRSQDSNLHHP